MLINKWIEAGIDILHVLFTLYIFFRFFGIFFNRKKSGVQVTVGVLILVAWQIDVFGMISMIPIEWNIVVSIGCKLRSNGMPVPLLRNCYSIFNGTKYR